MPGSIGENGGECLTESVKMAENAGQHLRGWQGMAEAAHIMGYGYEKSRRKNSTVLQADEKEA